MDAPVFITSEIYRGSSYGPRHPLAIPRVSVVTDLLRALGWLAPGQARVSPRARPAALTRFHTPAYIAALTRAEAAQQVSAEARARHGLGTLSNPVFPEMFRRPATAAGGTLLAAQMLSAGPGRIFNPGGGTHHGMADRASGFCYLNDPVLGILALRAAGLTRIAYVDIDAHHADGVEAALAGTPGLLLISTHEERRWPFTGALEETAGGVALNLPLPRGASDSDFRLALDRVILPAVAAHAPQVVILQCGADALAEDPLARLAFSNRAHLAALAGLMPLCDRLLVLGGGGYNPWTVARCWTAIWGALNGHEMPDRLPGAARAVLAPLDWPRAARPGPDLLTTLVDAPREAPALQATRARVAALQARFGAGG